MGIHTGPVIAGAKGTPSDETNTGDLNGGKPWENHGKPW